MTLASTMYTVLYYRRTQKMHKSKGVSKMDGTLVVDPPQVRLLQMVEPDNDDDVNGSKHSNSVLFAGLKTDICAQDLQADDVIVLGSYEVQIVARHHNAAASASFEPPRSVVAPHASSSLLQQRRAPLASTSIQSSGLKRKPAAAAPVVAPKWRKAAEATAAAAAAAAPFGKKVPLSTSSMVKTAKTGIVGPQSVAAAARVSVSPPPSVLASTTDADAAPVPNRPFKSNKVAVPPPPRTMAQAAAKNEMAAAPHVAKQPPVLSGRSTTTTMSNPTPCNRDAWSDIPLPVMVRAVLRPHQVDGVRFLWQALSKHGGALLCDEMGLGKTLMTIAVVAALHRQERNKQFVVVCPSSLVHNWAQEFDKWLGRASQPKRVVISKGGAEGRQQIIAYCSSMKQQLLHSVGQVLIVSYDLYRRNVEYFQAINADAVRLLVVDEGHRLKNTKGSQALSALASLTSGARLCITATPIQNNLSEFYNICDFCCPGVLGGLTDFRKQYEQPIAASNAKNATPAQKALAQECSRALERITQSFMIRRLQKNVLQTMLPPRTELLMFCRPSNTQQDRYRILTKSCNINGSQADALPTLTRLRKLCTHPCLLHDDSDDLVRPLQAAAAADSGKLQVLEALLLAIRRDAPEDKVVIVSNFTSALTVVEQLVLIPHQLPSLRLDGTTELARRQTLVDTFHRTSTERTFCFLLSSKAGGCGLNLVGANRMILLDPCWNPANDVQAMGRVYRQGQTKSCYIYRFFTAGTVEEVIYQRQYQKSNLNALTVDSKVTKKQASRKTSSSGFTKEELADCFTLKTDCASDTKRKMGSRWPDYTGADCLRDRVHGDVPLLQLCAQLAPSGVLSFVHVVSADDLAVLAVAEKDAEAGSDDQIDLSDAYNSDDHDEAEF